MCEKFIEILKGLIMVTGTLQTLGVSLRIYLKKKTKQNNNKKSPNII